MFSGDSVYNVIALSLIAVIVAVLLICWMRKEKNPRIQVGLALIAGGALGNVVDRLLYGGVVDFLDFHWNDLHWPAFNMADTFICIGAAIIIFETIFSRKK